MKLSEIRLRLAAQILIGLSIGLFIGLVVDGVVWLGALASALDGHRSDLVPWIARTTVVGDGVTVVSGWGVVVLPIILGAVGAAAVLVRHLKSRFTSSA